MKKRSPAGKKIDRLSKNAVTARRPPCQCGGTSPSANERSRISMLEAWIGARRVGRSARAKLLSFWAMTHHHSLPGVHALQLAELVGRWGITPEKLLRPLGPSAESLADPRSRLSVATGGDVAPRPGGAAAGR